jgi:hypothetical protein
MRYDFSDLSKLPIQESHLYWCMLKGYEAAADPDASIHDCFYGPSPDTRIRCYRIAWRTAFRRARQVRRDRALAEAFNRMIGRQVWEVAA